MKQFNKTYNTSKGLPPFYHQKKRESIVRPLEHLARMLYAGDEMADTLEAVLSTIINYPLRMVGPQQTTVDALEIQRKQVIETLQEQHGFLERFQAQRELEEMATGPSGTTHPCKPVTMEDIRDVFKREYESDMLPNLLSGIGGMFPKQMTFVTDDTFIDAVATAGQGSHVCGESSVSAFLHHLPNLLLEISNGLHGQGLNSNDQVFLRGVVDTGCVIVQHCKGTKTINPEDWIGRLMKTGDTELLPEETPRATPYIKAAKLAIELITMCGYDVDMASANATTGCFMDVTNRGSMYSVKVRVKHQNTANHMNSPKKLLLVFELRGTGAMFVKVKPQRGSEWQAGSDLKKLAVDEDDDKCSKMRELYEVVSGLGKFSGGSTKWSDQEKRFRARAMVLRQQREKEAANAALSATPAPAPAPTHAMTTEEHTATAEYPTESAMDTTPTVSPSEPESESLPNWLALVNGLTENVAAEQKTKEAAQQELQLAKETIRQQQQELATANNQVAMQAGRACAIDKENTKVTKEVSALKKRMQEVTQNNHDLRAQVQSLQEQCLQAKEEVERLVRVVGEYREREDRIGRMLKGA